MSHHNEQTSGHPNEPDHRFPFQQHDSNAHPTLLPNGILNDEDDEVVPWPRRPSKSDSEERTTVLRVRQLPQDLTAREFAALFVFADGFLESDLINEADERSGMAMFASYHEAEKALQKMSSVSSGPYSRLAFEIAGKRGSQEPSATLSSSSKSNSSNNGSMPQISRLASYVKEKNTESHIGLNDFYGNGSSIPKSTGMTNSASSVPNTAYSNSAGTTVWSPTSPRFSIDLGKSPPNGLSMLPPSSSEDQDSWNRSSSNINNARFSQLSIGTGAPAQEARLQSQQSPTSNGHSNTSGMYPSIDNSMHSVAPKSNYPSAGPSPIFHSSPPKHYMPSNSSNGYGSHGTFAPRMTPQTAINTNPADQNPPCNTLYVGNLPLATTEEELKSLFSRQPGYRRLCYRTKSNGPMCFVEFEDVHYAINSLKLLQGVILSSSIKGGIRLSFSKNPLGVRKMDSNQLMPNQNGMANPSNMNNYNAMHAPPGLQSGQGHGHVQPHTTTNPIWR